MIPKVLNQGSKAPPTDCRHSVSGSISLPSSGCFSPFHHGTGSLSVAQEYLGLEGGPPMFRQDFSCPALLTDRKAFSPYGPVPSSVAPFLTFPVLPFLPPPFSPFSPPHY